MNLAFEAALAARLLWMGVICLNGIGGFEKEAEAAAQAAYDAVDQLAYYDFVDWHHYGANAPLLLRDIPQLAEHYALAYEQCCEAAPNQEKKRLDLESGLRHEQYMQDLADTYAEIEWELAEGWKQDCLDNGLI
ncbi:MULTISPECIES: hypothetical protein [unclassified Pseudomonas]|uniref:hypothetical protein n=1 Tax=unclassified Pseudomonas TaxID=196821 RepID=UPI002B22DE4E|nr:MULTISPECIES: hypothetical protein [unclassified Pseudomonas]MEA9979852.1 hypothetical protein [Pseudomonas sp. RTS4]MEA9996484.1 hypothetical protein [Pseudomonas sp. AA4]MEB0198154.1 hypothetical protein [Pseudomonas sp. 5S4]MEB0222239.1 hypothetical protein [Pseudomonas sp. AB12(2023)]MEB0247857.1 hypothetical protein [Pseudomonas sp. 10S5]